MQLIILLICNFLFCYEGIELPKILENEQIIYHDYYTLSYSETHEQANWVAYRLTSKQVLGKFSRTNDFRIDPKVTTGSAKLSHYKGSGYDRGHLAPAADFKWSHTAMSESFYMSNMSPQVPGFNRGVWKNLESKVRDWAEQYDEISIVTGPILTNHLPSIGQSEVSIPEYYYKVILDYSGQKHKAIGFILPNQKSKESLQSYAIAVDEVERKTGFDFFHELPDEIETKLEGAVIVKDWNWGDTYTSKSSAISKSKLKINNKSLERLPEGSSIQCFGKTKKGLRCRKKTLNADGYCQHHKSQK